MSVIIDHYDSEHITLRIKWQLEIFDIKGMQEIRFFLIIKNCYMHY